MHPRRPYVILSAKAPLLQPKLRATPPTSEVHQSVRPSASVLLIRVEGFRVWGFGRTIVYRVSHGRLNVYDLGPRI